MLALAILLLQAPAAQPDDIVVMGERLKRLRFSGGVDRRGRVRCKIRQSSGDPAFDAIACQSVRDCAAIKLSTSAEVQACLEQRLKVRFDLLQAQDRNRADPL
jgi:hypothetical protein